MFVVNPHVNSFEETIALVEKDADHIELDNFEPMMGKERTAIATSFKHVLSIVHHSSGVNDVGVVNAVVSPKTPLPQVMAFVSKLSLLQKSPPGIDEKLKKLKWKVCAPLSPAPAPSAATLLFSVGRLCQHARQFTRCLQFSG